METKRVFFSFHVPDEIASRLLHDLSTLKNITLYPQENLHITIKFVGDVAGDQISMLSEIASEVSKDIPSISFEPTLFYVADDRLRLGIKKNRSLAELERRISVELSKKGKGKPEINIYTPHITLGRPEMGFSVSGIALSPQDYKHRSAIFGLFESKPGENKMGSYLLIRSFPLQGSGQAVAEKKYFTRIALPSRPQPDTLVSIFLLKMFGRDVFPGIEDAVCEVRPAIEAGSEARWESQGILLLDLAGGKFDHHNKTHKTTTTRLIAEYLGVLDEPALAKLLEYTQRDDFFGRGTVSDDAIDRALGLSGIIAALNKQFSKDPNRVCEAVLPLLSAHYAEERRRTGELPQEFESKKQNGDVVEFEVKQKDKKLRVVMVKSDNPSLAGFLRSTIGGKYDVVLQRSEKGHTNILTRPAKRIDLRDVAALIRLKEAEIRETPLENVTLADLTRPGRFTKVKEWYYDRATNSVQNGGLNPQDVEPTKIPWEGFQELMSDGLFGVRWE